MSTKIPALPSGKPADHDAVATIVRRHIASPEGKRLLESETARQLQRVADAIGYAP